MKILGDILVMNKRESLYRKRYLPIKDPYRTGAARTTLLAIATTQECRKPPNFSLLWQSCHVVYWLQGWTHAINLAFGLPWKSKLKVLIFLFTMARSDFLLINLITFAVFFLVVMGQPAGAGEGSVQGVISLDAARPTVNAARYDVKTKNPVEPMEKQRAIVYLENDSGTYPKAKGNEKVMIEQKGYQFRPGILPVRTGSVAFFPNKDEEFHNVFSYSRSKRFDLGRFRKEEPSPEVVFDKPGLVKVYCEIHKHMRCLVLVLDTPWFVLTDENGQYQLKGIPEGDYTMKVLLPSEKTIEKRITIMAGKTVRIDMPGQLASGRP
jgi:plastocyanin